MLTDQILFALLVTIFTTILHYYIGVINLWYMPAVEVAIALLFYELLKAMYSSYKTYDEHKKTEQKARVKETQNIDQLTIDNTAKNTHVDYSPSMDSVEVSSKGESKNIRFGKEDKILEFDKNSLIIQDVEIVNGEEEPVTDSEIDGTSDIDEENI